MEVEPLVLTVPLRAAVDSCEGVSLPPAAGVLTGSLLPLPQPASRPTHRAAESIRARVLFFMTFILQSCIVLVAFGNGYQYIDGL